MELWFFLGVALEILVTAEIWNSKVSWTPILYITNDPYAKEPSIYENSPPGNFPRTQSTSTYSLPLRTDYADSNHSWASLGNPQGADSHWILIPLEHILLGFLCIYMEGARLLSRSYMRTTGSSSGSMATLQVRPVTWDLDTSLGSATLDPQNKFTDHGLQSPECTPNGKDGLLPSWKSYQKETEPISHLSGSLNALRAYGSGLHKMNRVFQNSVD